LHVNDTVSALLQCKFRADMGQVMYALKLASSAAVAGALGWALTGNGSWATLTVSFVGTREGSAVGGSFNTAMLRMQGTVIGALFAFVVVVVLPGTLASGVGAGRLLLLAFFTFLTTYLRLNPEYSYAGVVAAFTAYIVALGVPDGADPQGARSYAHRRIEQNVLGLMVLVVVEVVLLPTYASDAGRRAAAETVRATEHAAELVYDASAVGTDCGRCRRRAAADAQTALDDVKDCLSAQNTLLVQAAVEPHLWSPKFPLAPYQTLAVDLESVRRILGLMRAALAAMSMRRDDNSMNGKEDPRAQVRELLTPTDRFVTELRRAVKRRLDHAAEDLGAGVGRWETRAASASIARAQASLERAFILHTLTIRQRYQAGDPSMFLPNHLMVPWHAYMLCTQVLAAHVDSLGAASMEALLAIAPPCVESAEAAARKSVDAGSRAGASLDGRTGGGAGGDGKTRPSGGGGGGVSGDGGSDGDGGGGKRNVAEGAEMCGVCVEVPDAHGPETAEAQGGGALVESSHATAAAAGTAVAAPLAVEEVQGTPSKQPLLHSERRPR
jgi:bacterioferritin-associated ferredoxin